MTDLQAPELRRILAENLRARRKELGMTQAAVADAIDVTQPYIAALESAKVSPRVEQLAKLSEALKTTPAALLTEGNFSAAGVD